MLEMESKPNLKLVYGVVILIFGLVLLFIINSKNKKDDMNYVSVWLDDFRSKDYISCDELVKSSQYKLEPYNIAVYMKNTDNLEYMLDKLVDCIQDIDISESKLLDDGTKVFKVKVSYKPYAKKSDSFLVNDLKDLTEGYKTGAKDESVFKSELEQIVDESFKSSCFQESDSGICSEVLTLSEKETNGVTCVYGTMDFINSLLSDSNIKNNVTKYQERIMMEVESLIKSN